MIVRVSIYIQPAVHEVTFPCLRHFVEAPVLSHAPNVHPNLCTLNAYPMPLIARLKRLYGWSRSTGLFSKSLHMVRSLQWTAALFVVLILVETGALFIPLSRTILSEPFDSQVPHSVATAELNAIQQALSSIIRQLIQQPNTQNHNQQPNRHNNQECKPKPPQHHRTSPNTAPHAPIPEILRYLRCGDGSRMLP